MIFKVNTIYTTLLTMLAAGAVCCSCTNDSENGTTDPAPQPPVEVVSDVECYVTSAGGQNLFTKVPVNFAGVSMSPYRVTLDAANTYQTIVGFGPAITGSTCYNLMKMTKEDRTAILTKCFDPKSGVGFSFIRVHIGGSDFSMDEYTCCDQPGIEFFAIPEVEKQSIFPILREIMTINPAVQIIGSPWSCPKWMKGTVADPSKPYDSWTSGRLNPKYYADYAEYFVEWVNEMEQNGFPIHSITMQNEPLNHGNSMSLYMPWQDQRDFVKVLGPALQKANIKAKILAYDHNYNYDNVAGQKDYPLNLFADADASQWIDGSAWHNYGGNVSELDRILQVAPSKSIYFTEASIGTWNYTFAGCLINDFESIFLGTMARECKGVTLWNMMLDDKGAPNRPGGCTTCFGAIDISSSDYKTLKFNSHYYNLAHCSKVILPGAERIGTTGYTNANLIYQAYRNTDGSYGVIVLNKNEDSSTIALQGAAKGFKYAVPGRSIASFRWSEK